MKRREGILYTEWKSSTPNAAALLVHGLGGHSGRWEFLAEFFLGHNVSSYAIELKGFGETEGLKGHVDSLDTYLDDIATLRNIIKRENPGKKIFLVGESMGGLIVFLTVGKRQGLFDGLVCITPAIKSKIRFNILGYFDIFLNYYIRPKKQYRVKLDSSMCTRDLEYKKVMDSHSSEHRLVTSNLLVKLVLAQIEARKLKDSIAVPLLLLVSGSDILVDSDKTKTFFSELTAKDKTMIIYPEMYHALSIDIGREKVFNDILKWMEARI